MTEKNAKNEEISQSIGRFDRSFMIHMIKDFFFILLLVTILEFSLKAALVYYDFQTQAKADVENVATDITENVRSIMENEGGPVAARTLYPILERNWDDLGYNIAIEPSEETKKSINQTFDFIPKGIPADSWPDGTFKVAQIDIQAQEFCLSCHTTAKEGDILGTVIVRNYLSTNFAKWWHDVKLSSNLALGKILLHSVLLFILLRARMEPLLRLRSVVSNLARAYGGLHHRAEVRSSDEFGVLANDLNLFLDRISRLIGELDDVLRNVVTVNDDIISVQGSLRDQADSVVSRTRGLERKAVASIKREPLLSEVWFDTAKNSIADLDKALAKAGNIPKKGGLVESLKSVVVNAERQVKTSEKLFAEFSIISQETQSFQTAIVEMARLEERMKGIIETGTILVGRLQPKK